jgi:hypothetical protein
MKNRCVAWEKKIETNTRIGETNFKIIVWK